MASPVGSSIFFALSLLVICLLVLLLIRYYLPLRATPSYLLVPVFLALALPSSIILLVPIDLASSAGAGSQETRGIWLPERTLRVCWRISYWLTFCLTWFILPLLGEYSDSGARDPMSRFRYSLRSNARYQLIVLGCAIFGAVYFFMQSGVNFVSLRALVMALAYAWGLVLALYLMGNGLVAIPKRLIKDASISGRLRRLQEQAPRAHERMTEATDSLAELEEQVLLLRQRKTGTAKEFQDWIEELAETSRSPEAYAAPNGGASRTTTGAKLPNVITERYLAEFSRKLKRARHKRARFVSEWAQLVQKALDIQRILDSTGTKSLNFQDQQDTPVRRLGINFMSPRARYHLHTQVYPALRLGLSAILSLASVCIVWSELVKHTLPKASIIVLTVIHYPSNGEARGELTFGNQIVAGMWLCYMCAATLYSITEIKVWGNRALVRRQTYSESACWYAGQVAKLTVPLSYNFAEMVDPHIFQGTVFYDFLGRLVDLTPLGKGFSAWFPIFVVIPVLASLFGLYGKVKRWTGFGNWVLADDEEEEQTRGEVLLGSGSWREGQALIERELHGAAGSSAGAGALGLFSREVSPSNVGSRGSFEQNRRTSLRGAAEGTTTSATAESSSSRRGAGDRGRDVEAQRRRNDDEPEEEEENFFQGFVHRVKNTFETNDRPAWLDNLRPKWLDRNSDNDNDPGSSPNLGKWFGGRARQGQVRL